MFNNIKDFYPTPKPLINKMLSKIDWKMVQSVLEPSAGKGDLVEAIIERFKYSRSAYYNREAKWDVDTIEINENLQHILKGKGYRVIHNDYLSFFSYKTYDVIIANFPFSDGEKHLLKGLEMQERTGGQLLCLVIVRQLKILILIQEKIF
jgi:phospholipid N-methyltransferase